MGSFRAKTFLQKAQDFSLTIYAPQILKPSLHYECLYLFTGRTKLVDHRSMNKSYPP